MGAGLYRAKTAEDYKLVEKCKTGKYFRKGRVFRALWAEPAGESSSDVPTVSSRYSGAYIANKPRWFVVILDKKSHCLAFTISTYGGRGASKFGLRSDDLVAVVPKGESQSTTSISTSEKRPLQIIIENREDRMTELDPASVIDVTKIYTVEYNIKVSTVGRIAPEDTPYLSRWAHKVWAMKTQFTVPHSRDPDFVDRTERFKVNALFKTVLLGKPRANHQSVMAALVGLSGIGSV